MSGEDRHLIVLSIIGLNEDLNLMKRCVHIKESGTIAV